MGSSTACYFIDNRVVYVRNVGDLTADDFRAVDQEIIALMEIAKSQGTEKVHVLVDCMDMTKLPPLIDLEGGRILKYLSDPICGWTIVISPSKNVFLKILSRLLTSIAGAQLHMANTYQQATNFLNQVDSFHEELPNLESWTDKIRAGND